MLKTEQPRSGPGDGRENMSNQEMSLNGDRKLEVGWRESENWG